MLLDHETGNLHSGIELRIVEGALAFGVDPHHAAELAGERPEAL